jgi:hypothetical protein
MKPKAKIQSGSRISIIKAIVYAKRVFIIIELDNGIKHLHELSQINGADISHSNELLKIQSQTDLAIEMFTKGRSLGRRQLR